MGNGVIISALNVHVLFSLFMFLHGVEISRIVKVVALSFVCSLVAVFVLLVALFDLKNVLSVIVPISVLALPFVALYYARDELVQRVNAVEVILLNVVAIPYVLSSKILHFLVNPIWWLHLPIGFSLVVNAVISLWPSLISLYLIRKGEEPGRLVKLLLVTWVMLVYGLLLLHSAINASVGFDSSSVFRWLLSLFTALVVVRVVLLFISVFELAKKDGVLGNGESGAEHGTHTGFMASRFVLPRVSYVGVGVAALVLLFAYPQVILFAVIQYGISLEDLQSWSLVVVSAVALYFSYETDLEQVDLTED